MIVLRDPFFQDPSDLIQVRTKLTKYPVLVEKSLKIYLVFRPAAKSGPGTYGAGGIPHAAMEEANRVSLIVFHSKVY